MVKVPEKFSAPTLAVPDRTAVKVPVPASAPLNRSLQPLVVPVSTACSALSLLVRSPGEYVIFPAMLVQLSMTT